MNCLEVSKIRYPFKVKTFPLMARLYYGWSKGANKIYRKTCRFLFSKAHKMGVNQIGRFSIKLNSGDKNIKFNTRNTQFHSVYCYNEKNVYEPELTALLEYFIGENDVFYDIGANFGYFSLYLASRNAFNGKVYSFEPNPEVFQDLESCVKQAGLQDRIISYNIGVSDSVGELNFKLPDGVQSGYGHIDKGGNGIKIKTNRLDGLDIEKPNFLKIDVEGHEYEVLNSGIDLIKNSNPYIVFESWYTGIGKDNWQKPFKLLNELEYIFYFVNFNNSNMPNLGQLKFTEINIDNRLKFPDGTNIFAVPRIKNKELI